jgi:hypothetical protein
MNFMSNDAMTKLTLTALTRLSHSSDPGHKQDVCTLCLATDANGCGFSTSVDRPDALSALQKIADMYRILVAIHRNCIFVTEPKTGFSRPYAAFTKFTHQFVVTD